MDRFRYADAGPGRQDSIKIPSRQCVVFPLRCLVLTKMARKGVHGERCRLMANNLHLSGIIYGWRSPVHWQRRRREKRSEVEIIFHKVSAKFETLFACSAAALIISNLYSMIFTGRISTNYRMIYRLKRPDRAVLTENEIILAFQTVSVEFGTRRPWIDTVKLNNQIGLFWI